MKTLLVTLSFLLLSHVSFASNNIKLLVKGMHCQSCVRHLTTSLKANDAVETVSVNLETRTASIHLKEKKQLSDSELKTLVEKAGYELESIEH